MVKVLNFYADDSGARHPGRPENQFWNAHCHWFGLGGVLIFESDEGDARRSIREFRARWPQLKETPLHSYEIRNQRDGFHWLTTLHSRKLDQFYEGLTALVLGLPILGVACMIDGPGYNARYNQKYGDARWMMCKTAFVIAVERAAKHAISCESKLRVLVERSNTLAENDLRSYYEALKSEGHPFDATPADTYAPLGKDEYSSVLYEFVIKFKSSPLMQIADLVLWPLCKAGYEPAYRTYVELKAAGRLLECLYPGNEDSLGTKYSCFDLWKREHQKQSPALRRGSVGHRASDDLMG